MVAGDPGARGRRRAALSMADPSPIRTLGRSVRNQFRGPAEPDGRLAHDRNAFNLIRLACATAVIFSHAHDLTLPQVWQDATVRWLGVPIATVAVYVFFVLSGFLVTMSYDRRRDPAAFIRARALRILPGLWVMLLVMVPVLGLLFSPLALGDFLTAPKTVAYLITNAILSNTFYLAAANTLPGVFGANPVAGIINGSLWTVAIEVQCYIALLIAAMAGLIFNRARFLMLAAAFILFFLLFPAGIFPLTGLVRRLALPFLFGAAAYVFRDRLPLSGPLAGIGLIIAIALPTGTITPNLVQPVLNLAELKAVAVQLAFGYAALVFAFRAPKAVTQFSAGLPDLSYGIYIYAFPIQQAVVASGLGVTPMSNLILSLMVIVPLAALSWYLVEKPALKLKALPARATRLDAAQ